MGDTTILISNNENSPIVNEANYFFNMFAIEKSVAATKSFVQTLLILKTIFICQGKNRLMII